MKKYYKEIIIGLITGLLNGLFGSGGGTIVVPCMEKFLKIDSKKSHSSAIMVILMMSLVSSVIYVKKGYFDLKLWFYVSIGGVIGGIIGAKILSKIPQKWLKIIFGTVILMSSFKMIF